jgi:hypothetical protein
MVAIQYNHAGDIKLGRCTKYEVEDLLLYIKQKCEEGCTVILKKINLNEFYLSVPITMELLTIETPFIYTHDSVVNSPFYFVDVYIPDKMVCIGYDTDMNTYVSNIEYEGCIRKEFGCEPFLYEILPFSECEYENEEQYTQLHMHMAKQFFVCSG